MENCWLFLLSDLDAQLMIWAYLLFIFFNRNGVIFQKFKCQLCSYDLYHKWHKVISIAIKIEYFKIIFWAFWTFPSSVINQEEEWTTKSSVSKCTLNLSCKCFQCFDTNIWSRVCKYLCYVAHKPNDRYEGGCAYSFSIIQRIEVMSLERMKCFPV